MPLSASTCAIVYIMFLFLTQATESVSRASEVSFPGFNQEEGIEEISRDLESLAFSPDSSLFKPSSSQEETQSTTSTLDDSISQATCAQYLKPPDNTDDGKVGALQWFVDECSFGSLGSVMKRP